jgi:glycosyltransferase involved in cell wall biosynthesis
MKSILFIVAFPPKLNSSARFRIELYEEVLKEHNYLFKYANFWSSSMYDKLYLPGYFTTKLIGLISGFFRRGIQLLSVFKYDYIFILREATPIGPPIFEWFCCNVLKKKVIYDFDDAIWMPLNTNRNNLAKKFKSFWKVEKICKWSYKVSVGSPFLYDFAIKYSCNAVLNPTCVDTIRMHNTLKNQQSIKGKNLVIGWTGTFSNLKHLDVIVDVLTELELTYNFDFVLIADQDPHLPLKNYRFKKWKEITEIEDLLECNIGVMPLENDLYSQGKCGFKLIQFMALGIPVAASPVGVNTKIIDQNINGYLCDSYDEWKQAFIKLLENEEIRIQMGVLGRQKIIQNYSVESNSTIFLNLFK